MEGMKSWTRRNELDGFSAHSICLAFFWIKRLENYVRFSLGRVRESVNLTLQLFCRSWLWFKEEKSRRTSEWVWASDFSNRHDLKFLWNFCALTCIHLLLQDINDQPPNPNPPVPEPRVGPKPKVSFSFHFFYLQYWDSHNLLFSRIRLRNSLSEPLTLNSNFLLCLFVWSCWFHFL